MKKLIYICIFVLSASSMKAQHAYYRLDVGTNNIYSFAVANLATAGINALANDMLFDNAYTYTILSPCNNNDDIKVKGPNVLSLNARDLFSDVTLGGRAGYQSFNPGSFNWGIFGSVHYRVNQYNTTLHGIDSEYHHRIQRALIGGGLLFKFGNIESSTQFIFEASLRYEVPLSYSGPSGKNASEMLNSGLSSRFALRVNGNGALQGLGIYADIPYYSSFKSSGVYQTTPDIKMFTIGLIYTITPWKIKDTY